MFWGLLWGWLFWDSIPDDLAWIGIAVIIAAGIVIRKRGPLLVIARTPATEATLCFWK
jgi:drug/metabolite transporter (DMT)-like permease